MRIFVILTLLLLLTHCSPTPTQNGEMEAALTLLENHSTTNSNSYTVKDVTFSTNLDSSIATATSRHTSVTSTTSSVTTITSSTTVTSSVSINPADLGSVNGEATLPGLSDYSGIEVLISNSNLQTITDSQGNYEIDQVAPGSYHIYFEKEGYYRGQIQSVKVLPGAQTTNPAFELLPLTNASVYIRLANGNATTMSRTVAVELGATTDSVNMELSETGDFTNVTWAPMTTDTSYTFSTPGSKKLYVRFQDAQQLPTSAFFASIIVDLFPADQNSITTAISQITPPAPPVVPISIKYSSNVKEMKFSLKKDFSASTWLPIASSYNFQLPQDNQSCGSQTIYGKVRDGDQLESQVTSLVIELNCSQGVTSAGAFPLNSLMNMLVASSNNSMLIVGGEISSSLGSCMKTPYLFTPAANTWTQLPPPLKTAASDATGVWNDAMLLTFGGHDCDVLSNGVGLQMYTVDTGSWTVGNAPGEPPGRAGVKSVWTGTEFIILASSFYQDTDPWQGRVFAYNPKTNRWRESISSPFSTTYGDYYVNISGAVWDGNEMLVFSAKVPHDQPGAPSDPISSDNPVMAYNPASDTWRALSLTSGFTTTGSTHPTYGTMYMKLGSRVVPAPYLDYDVNLTSMQWEQYDFHLPDQLICNDNQCIIIGNYLYYSPEKKIYLINAFD